MARVLLGVGGGIAAYKSVVVARRLREAGHEVRAIPTRAALEFVGAATWEAITGQPATCDVFADSAGVDHVRLGAGADLVLVAPATADLLARAAAGLADDLLTTTLLAASAPVWFFPAMHSAMWLAAPTQANVATLRARGARVPDPATGRLTGADSGPGRMAEPEEIVALALAQLDRPAAGADLAGRRLVVTAGGTREALDPVRYLGNASSGKQGFAIAAEAARRGADVTLIAANAEPPTPPGVRRVDVVSAAELGAAVAAEAPLADAVVMAAAVADFRPAEAASAKIKRAGRDGLSLRLVANPDILAGLVAARRPGQVVVGFAAETGDADGSPLDHARRKAAAKGADLTVANQVGAGLGIGADVNRVWLLGPDGQVRGEAAGAKAEVARVVTDGIVRLLTPR